ncbi:unnamed protein product [Closterium sp. Naga37s-1]|nr:unnamed protein product [Closterium sp. Naga37s-1]
MNRIFGVKKEKTPAPSLTEASERINARGDSLDEKIRKLEAELVRYRDQIKRTRPGPAQEALKARAMRVLKQKKMLEGQRDNLYNQSFNVEQVAFAQEGIKDAQATVAAMKAANKELKTQMKSVKIEDIDSMQDDMFDLMDYSNEIQQALGQSYGVPDDIDEDELLGELDALEADMGVDTADATPSYLLPDSEPDALEAEPDLFLPSAPTANTASAVPVAEPARPLRT